MNVCVVTIRHTGTQWLLRELESVFGIEAKFVHVGDTNLVTEPGPLRSGVKCVTIKYPPALHAISCLNRGVDHALHAFPVLSDWARVYDNLHEFDLFGDPGEEWAKLAAYLGVEPQAEPDYTPEHMSEDITGAKAAYLKDGSLPLAITREMERVPRVWYPETGEDPPDNGVVKVKLLTVPHSGTGYVRKILRAFGIASGSRHFVPGDLDPDTHLAAEATKVVVTLYDPVLTVVAHMNRARTEPAKLDAVQAAVEMIHALPAKLDGAPNTHLFDVLSSSPEAEVERLADFLQRPLPLRVDLSAENSVLDIDGVKARYLMGHPDDVLAPYIADFQADADLVAFYRSHGVEYPWMEGV